MSEENPPIVPSPAPEKARKPRWAKRELTDDEWVAHDARRTLRANFVFGLLFAAVGGVMVAASTRSEAVRIGGERIEIATRHYPTLHAVGWALVGVASICLSVAVIGWGVSLGQRSNKDV
jgi:hypothetical protein